MRMVQVPQATAAVCERVVGAGDHVGGGADRVTLLIRMSAPSSGSPTPLSPSCETVTSAGVTAGSVPARGPSDWWSSRPDRSPSDVELLDGADDVDVVADFRLRVVDVLKRSTPAVGSWM